MAKRQYDENVVVSMLRKHPLITVDVVQKTIKKAIEGVGIHTLGRIDYLVNYCNYFVTSDKNFKAQINFKEKDNFNKEEKVIKKTKFLSDMILNIKSFKS